MPAIARKLSRMIRDKFTWFAYLMLAYYAYTQAALGPLMPFLRKEMHLNYTVAGFHFSAFAFGMVLAGISSDRIAEKMGRRWLFWTGGTGMAVSVILFILGFTPVLTILTAFGMGCFGTFLLVMIQSTLADHHGDFKATALTESNVIASIGAGLAPLLVGSLQQTALGWRAALMVAVFFYAVMTARFYAQPLPLKRQNHTDEKDTGTKLPSLFWNYWFVLFLSVSIEWSIVFWGAEFLEKSTGLERATAATIMSVYFVAVVIGRAMGSRLTRTLQTGVLLLMALLLTGGGFLLFWLAPVTILSVMGLFITGLGVANLFPLTLSVASSIVEPHQSDTASGRISLGAGLAILIAPQILGSFADATTIQTAYGVVGILLVMALIVTLRTNHRAKNL